MAISVVDLFSVGIGPSSSDAVGPLRAVRRFAVRVVEERVAGVVARGRAELFGSPGATGRGHGRDLARVIHDPIPLTRQRYTPNSGLPSPTSQKGDQ